MRRHPGSSFLVVTVLLVGGSAACMGRVDPGDPGSSGGSSSGATSSGGSASGGETGSSSGGSSSGGPTNGPCASLPVPDIARECPDGSSVGGHYVLSDNQCLLQFTCPTGSSSGPGSSSSSSSGGSSSGTTIDPCSPGAPCQQGSGCGTVTPVGGCSTTCSCSAAGTFQCALTCEPPLDGCQQGGSCNPGSECGIDGVMGTPYCSTNCYCDPSGRYECSTGCEDASPPPPPPPPPNNPCPDYAVPDICEVCSNGTTECAHAIFADGQCQTEICPPGL
jgi:hypothetical protein